MGEITSTFDMEEALDEYYFKVVLESAEKYLTKEDYNITDVYKRQNIISAQAKKMITILNIMFGSRVSLTAGMRFRR